MDEHKNTFRVSFDRSLQEHPGLKPFAERCLSARQQLFDSYVAIYDAAKAGKPISAKDYREVEERYNRKCAALEKEFEKALPGIVALEEKQGKILESPNPNIFSDQRYIVTEHDRQRHARFIKSDFQMMMTARPGDIEELTPRQSQTFADSKPYISALIKREGPLKEKNLNIAPDTTRERLLPALLAKNPGVALGDVHFFGETNLYLASQMRELKKAGVDTIYLEDEDKHFKSMSALSDEQLRQLLRDRKLGDIILLGKAEADLTDPARSNTDPDGTYVQMMLAAREQGIRIIPIDKKGLARDQEPMVHRLATTNITWTDTIRRDRDLLEKQGKKAGKYIVWAGYDHLVDTPGSYGLVDDSLGLPVVAFEQGRKDNGAVRRGVENEADFYVKGGEQYVTRPGYPQITTLSKQVDAMRPLEGVPGVGSVISAMRDFCVQQKERSNQLFDENLRQLGVLPAPAVIAPVPQPSLEQKTER